MLGIEIEKGDLTLAKDRNTGREIAAVIGFTGKVKGNLTIALDFNSAEEFVKKMLSADVADREEVLDGVRELCNIVGGAAKADLNKMGLNLSVALPNVISGHNIEVAGMRSGVTLVVPFHSEHGSFDVRIGMA